MQTKSTLTGLTALSDAWRRRTKERLDPVEAAYCIRQINIAEGCLFACSHCFASPAISIELMSLDSFRELAREIGLALRQRREPLRFCYLGAETDLALIPGAEQYLEAWLEALPTWQPVKIYSHGWVLGVPGQVRAFDAFTASLARRPDRLETFAISIDLYNIYAKLNRAGYFHNLTEILRRLRKRFPLNKLKLQVTYPVERVAVDGPGCIRHYTRLLRSGQPLPPWEAVADSLRRVSVPAEKACAELTEAVFRAGVAAGLSFEAVVRIAHDNFAPFPSGRAKRHFRSRSVEDREATLRHQSRSCLKPLKGFHRENHGFVVKANGVVVPIDYAGYRKGDPLNGGAPTIAYAKSSPVTDRAWRPADLRPDSP